MKKTMLLFFAALFLFGCESDKFSPIGEWNIQDVDLDIDVGGSSLTEDGKKTLTLVMKSSLIDEIKRNGKIEFFADNTYRTSVSGEIESGTYRVINDGHTLSTISDADKKNDLMAIEKDEINDKTRLVFQMPLKDMEELKHIEKTEYGDFEVSITRMKIVFERKEK